jgi:hypothetical protein
LKWSIIINSLCYQQFKSLNLKIMKKSVLTIAIFITGLFISSLLVIGCGSKKEQTVEENHRHMEGDTTKHHDEMAMVYACTMHPEVTGKEGDKCSKCGMKLEAVKSADSTGVHEH